MADLKTNLLGFVMNSPVIGASGTVGYGVEYEELADFSKIGGISGKGLTILCKLKMFFKPFILRIKGQLRHTVPAVQTFVKPYCIFFKPNFRTKIRSK